MSVFDIVILGVLFVFFRDVDSKGDALAQLQGFSPLALDALKLLGRRRQARLVIS